MSTKALLLAITNTALYLCVCLLIGTGLLLEFRLDQDHGPLRLLSLSSDDWGEVHFAVALAFVGLAVLHLALNWSWIRTVLIRLKVAVVLAGLGMVFVVGLLLWPVQPSEAAGGNEQQHERDDD